jgi:O-antigen ligase
MNISAHKAHRSTNASSTDGRNGLSTFNRALVLGLCLVLIFAVLAFGAVEYWAVFVLELCAVGLFLAWAIQQLLSGKLMISKNPFYLPVLLFSIVALAQLALRRTAYMYDSQYEVLEYAVYGIVLLIASEVVNTKESKKLFALVVGAFGVLYAFFALAQDLSSNGKIFWLRSTRFHGSIYGSYVNRDHYAGLIEMLLPIPIVLSMSRLLKGPKRILTGFAGVLMASTIFLCGSRGGMVAFILEMALLGALLFAKKRQRAVVLGYSLLCVGTVAFIFISNNGRGLVRIGDLDAGIRPKIVHDGLRMFLQHPILGWGLGTFPTVYPEFRSFYTNLFVNEAHNDYLQLLVETGIVGFSLMIWFLIQLYRRGLSGLDHWQYHWDSVVSVAALVGCTGILVHSFVDFNLQIPANAAFFYVLCAIAVSRDLSRRTTIRYTRRIRAAESEPEEFADFGPRSELELS